MTCAVVLVVSGCGGSGSSNPPSEVRLANATLTHPSLSFIVNGSTTASALAFDATSSYVAPAAGGVNLQIDDGTSGAELNLISPTLAGGAYYTELAYESGGVVHTTMLDENAAAPPAGVAQLRVVDAAVDAGPLDVYVTDPAVTDLGTLVPDTGLTAGTQPTVSPALNYGASTVRVRVTGHGNKSDLRIDMPAVVLGSEQQVLLLLTPASGGVLLNGSTLVERGAYAATRNTNARVRLAAAVSGNAVVAASAGNLPIEAGSVAPAFGYYVLVPAASALNISVNGASVGAPAGSLVAGGDATLLVYGSPANATASLLADDNRLPASTSAVKLRLINGITGNVGALSLTADSSLVANDVGQGLASGYVEVPGSLNPTNLAFAAASRPGNYLTDNSSVLNEHSVYTVFAAGDVATPQVLIR